MNMSEILAVVMKTCHYPNYTFIYAKIKIYKTIILPFVCEWFLKYSLLRGKEYKLQMFDKSSKPFGPKRDKVNEQFRMLNNEAISPYRMEITSKGEVVMRKLLICTCHLVLLQYWNLGGMHISHFENGDHMVIRWWGCEVDGTVSAWWY
jgi:hypothetical protein